MRAAVLLVLIWEVAGTAVFILRSKGPGAGATITFLRQQHVAYLASPERAKSIVEAAERLNLLTFQQMREVQESRAFFEFYQPLEPLEKEQFVGLILPAGIRRIMDASRELPPDQQSSFLQKALFAASIDLLTPSPPIDPQALKRLQVAALQQYFGSLTEAERKTMTVQLKVVREYVRQP